MNTTSGRSGKKRPIVSVQVLAGAGVRSFVTLHTKLAKRDFTDFSGLSGKNNTTTFHVPHDQLQTDHDDTLPPMKWQLFLQWKRENHYSFKLNDLIPSVKMVPNSEVEEKLGDVWIVPGKVTLQIDGSAERIVTLPSDKPIVLKKSDSYQCDLVSSGSGINIPDSEINNYIVVKIEIFVIHSTLSIIEPVAVPPCNMLQTYGALLATNEEESKEKFCDMKITAIQLASCSGSKHEATPDHLVSDSKEDSDTPTLTDFYVHKAILASRSPVFAKMFSSDMLESATNTLTLPDIEPDALKELLTYIYTGECPNIKKHALSLLNQAEKYELSHLKALCERRLSYDLQISNVAKILVLADTLKAEQLKRNALLFINEHGHKVQSTDGWEDVKESKELLSDLFSTIHEPAAKKRKL